MMKKVTVTKTVIKIDGFKIIIVCGIIALWTFLKKENSFILSEKM